MKVDITPNIREYEGGVTYEWLEAQTLELDGFVKVAGQSILIDTPPDKIMPIAEAIFKTALTQGLGVGRDILLIVNYLVYEQDKLVTEAGDKEFDEDHKDDFK